MRGYLLLLVAISVICIGEIQFVNMQAVGRVYKNTNCKDLCKKTKCYSKTIDECGFNEALIGADGDCYCCDTCIDYRKGNLFKHFFL